MQTEAPATTHPEQPTPIQLQPNQLVVNKQQFQSLTDFRTNVMGLFIGLVTSPTVMTEILKNLNTGEFTSDLRDSIGDDVYNEIRTNFSLDFKDDIENIVAESCEDAVYDGIRAHTPQFNDISIKLQELGQLFSV